MSVLDDALAPLVDRPLDAEVLLRARLDTIRRDLTDFDRTLRLRSGGRTRRAAAHAVIRLSAEQAQVLRDLDALDTPHLDITWSSSA